MKKKALAVFLSVFFIMVVTDFAMAACTSFIAGKNATADGSVIAMHNEDLNGTIPQRVEVFPSKTFKKGEIEYLISGEPLWWVPKKYKVIQYNSGYDSTYNGDNPNLMNEFGVVSWDNAMTPRKELLDIEAGALNLVESRELKRIPLERAKTAREAVQILGYLVDTYGFQQNGMAYGIADPKEGWIVEVTKGKHWVAHRVPDDMVVFRSNCYRIQRVNLSDPDFMGSADLISYAIQKGWWTGDPSDFNFSQAYGSPSSMAAASNTLREWGALRFLDPRYELDPNTFFPWVQRGLGDAIVPLKKIALEDAMAFGRIHYEGTPYDASAGPDPDDPTKVIPYKWGSPHWTVNRVICVDSTESSAVAQLRDWLPLEVGCVLWRADGSPCSSVFVPWYLGISTTPIEFRTGDSVPSDDSAWWIYRRLTNTIDAHYGDFIDTAKTQFSEMENKLLVAQKGIEIEALGHCELNQKQCEKFLTEYSGNKGLDALELAKQILTDLTQKSARGRWKNTVCTP